VSPGQHDDKVLYVQWSPFDTVAHVVSGATIALAAAADDAPVLFDFGDLRRSGDLDELENQLDQLCCATAEEYVAAIERSAGREPASRDMMERLAALDDVVFDGVPEEECDPSEGCDFLPADDTELLVPDDTPAPEFRSYDIIAKAMSGDIPSDIFEEFCQSTSGNSPAFSGHIDDRVDAERLPALVAALQARGYTVIED
jgi:hypothetical protein